MPSERKQITFIWFSLFGATIFFIAFGVLVGFIPLPSPHLPAQAVSDLYARNNLRIRIGVVVCTLVSGWCIPWSIVVAIQMARLERGVPVYAILSIITGALGSVIYMIPSMFLGIAAFTPERDPGLTLILHETAMLTLIAPNCWYPMQVLPLAAIAFTQKASDSTPFPRWIGYVCIFSVMTTVPSTLSLVFKQGPFAWNGLFGFWIPGVDFFGCIILTSWKMLGALRVQALKTAAVESLV